MCRVCEVGETPSFYGKKLEERESGATLSVLQVTLQENRLVSTSQIVSILSFSIIFSLMPMFSFRPLLNRDDISQYKGTDKNDAFL